MTQKEQPTLWTNVGQEVSATLWAPENAGPGVADALFSQLLKDLNPLVQMTILAENLNATIFVGRTLEQLSPESSEKVLRLVISTSQDIEQALYIGRDSVTVDVSGLAPEALTAFEQIMSRLRVTVSGKASETKREVRLPAATSTLLRNLS